MASEIIFDSEVVFDSEIAPDGEDSNLTSLYEVKLHFEQKLKISL